MMDQMYLQLTRCAYVGIKLKGLAEAAENYHVVIAENRKLYNEVQDLKGMHYMVLI